MKERFQGAATRETDEDEEERKEMRSMNEIVVIRQETLKLLEAFVQKSHMVPMEL